MENKLFLTIAVVISLFFCSFNVSAQENANRDKYGKVVRGPYLTNRFWDNWTIELGGGASMYLGGHTGEISSSITPSYNLYVGKWIKPSFGIRIGAGYFDQFHEDYQYSDYRFNTWNVHADFMLNINHAFGGYKETRVVSIIPYIGAGYAQANYFSNISATSNSFMADAGIITKFRVSNRVDLNLDFCAMGVSNNFDHIPSNSSFDLPVSAMASITFKLGKTNFTRASSYAADKVNAAVAATLAVKNSELAAAGARQKELESEISTLKGELAEKPKEITKEKIVYGEIPANAVVFFALGSSRVDKREMEHIENIACYAKQVISSGQNITLIGSADRGTGTAQTNMKLSLDRAESVKDILVKQFDVPSDKIIVKAEGDTNNRYGDAQLDRCVIIEK